MSMKRSLYDEILLEHNARPRYRGVLTGEGVLSRTLMNASCGDEVTVYLRMAEEVVVEASWEGKGCAIALASADLMCSVVAKKTEEEIKELRREFDRLVKGEMPEQQMKEMFGEAAALSTVSRMPARVKCAKVAWG